jgi:hypothetical protein
MDNSVSSGKRRGTLQQGLFEIQASLSLRSLLHLFSTPAAGYFFDKFWTRHSLQYSGIRFCTSTCTISVFCLFTDPSMAYPGLTAKGTDMGKILSLADQHMLQ